MTSAVETYSSPPTNTMVVTPSSLTIRTSPQTTGCCDDDEMYSTSGGQRTPHLSLPSNTVRSRRLEGADYQNYPWKFSSNDAFAVAAVNTMNINHKEVINYMKLDPRMSRIQHCVMCGRQDVHIPSQNKNVCKSCDSCFWLHSHWNVVIKFCKGCKNFFVLDEFQDKPEGTKCKKCRQRGRENYLQKKGQIVTPMMDSTTVTSLLLPSSTHSLHHHHEFFPCGDSPVSITSESDALSTTGSNKRGNDQIAAFIQASNFTTTQAFTSIANQVTPGNLLKKPPKMPKKTPTSSTAMLLGKPYQSEGYFFGTHNSENCINNSNPLINVPHDSLASDASSNGYGTPRVTKKAKFALSDHDSSNNNVIKSASTPKTLTSNLPSVQLASTPCMNSSLTLDTTATTTPYPLPLPLGSLGANTPSLAHPVTPVVKSDAQLAPMKYIKLNIGSNTAAASSAMTSATTNAMTAASAAMSSTSVKYDYSKLYVDMGGAMRDDHEEGDDLEEPASVRGGRRPSLGRLDKLKKYSVLVDVAQAASPDNLLGDTASSTLSPTSSSVDLDEATPSVGNFQRSASTTSNLSCATTSGHCSSDDEEGRRGNRDEFMNEEKWQWDPSVNPLMQLALLTSHEQLE